MFKVIKERFAVFGKEGSTSDGEGFIQKLWDDANGHFSEVAHLAKKDADGKLVGIWGAMSDVSRSFKPWEDGFSKGLYLAGVECVDHAEAPDGRTKWIIPGYEYIVVENHTGAFEETLGQMNEEGIFPGRGSSRLYRSGNGKGLSVFSDKRSVIRPELSGGKLGFWWEVPQ